MKLHQDSGHKIRTVSRPEAKLPLMLQTLVQAVCQSSWSLEGHPLQAPPEPGGTPTRPKGSFSSKTRAWR